MAKATLKQLWKQFNVFYMVSDLYLNIWSCWNTDRATMSRGKPVSILLGIAKQCRPFWYWICSMLVVQTAACLLYRLATKVWQCLLNASFPFSVLYFVLCRYFGVKAFCIKPTVCEFLRTSGWLDDERNCKHSGKCLNFYFYRFFSS